MFRGRWPMYLVGAGRRRSHGNECALTRTAVSLSSPQASLIEERLSQHLSSRMTSPERRPRPLVATTSVFRLKTRGLLDLGWRASTISILLNWVVQVILLPRNVDERHVRLGNMLGRLTEFNKCWRLRTRFTREIVLNLNSRTIEYAHAFLLLD